MNLSLSRAIQKQICEKWELTILNLLKSKLGSVGRIRTSAWMTSLKSHVMCGAVLIGGHTDDATQVDRLLSGIFHLGGREEMINEGKLL
jgi:hypothetical protein